MTTAFSRLPPLIRPFLIRYSISSKKQNVRAWASSRSHVSGVTSRCKNWVKRPLASALVQVIFRPSCGKTEMVVSPFSNEMGVWMRKTSRGSSCATTPGRLDHFDILARAAIGDGRLVGVQFDDGVINAAPGKGGQDMLDGVDFGVALGKGSGAIGGGDVIDAAPRFPVCPPNQPGGSGCRNWAAPAGKSC